MFRVIEGDGPVVKNRIITYMDDVSDRPNGKQGIIGIT